MSLKEKYVLIIIAHFEFRDEELLAVKKALKDVHAHITIASSSLTPAHGTHGHVEKPDIVINNAGKQKHDAIIFIGGPGVKGYFNDSTVAHLIRNSFHDRALLAAIGSAPTLFANAGIITGKRVTSNPKQRHILEISGGYYSGKLVEQDGELITASGPLAAEEFGKAIVKALEWRRDRISHPR